MAPQRSVAVVPLITTRSSGGVTMDVRSENRNHSSDRATGVSAPALRAMHWAPDIKTECPLLPAGRAHRGTRAAWGLKRPPMQPGARPPPSQATRGPRPRRKREWKAGCDGHQAPRSHSQGSIRLPEIIGIGTSAGRADPGPARCRHYCGVWLSPHGGLWALRYRTPVPGRTVRLSHAGLLVPRSWSGLGQRGRSGLRPDQPPPQRGPGDSHGMSPPCAPVSTARTWGSPHWVQGSLTPAAGVREASLSVRFLGAGGCRCCGCTDPWARGDGARSHCGSRIHRCSDPGS